MSTRVKASELGRIYPPTAETRNWVTRPRLLEMLHGGSRATNEPVVLISAPAGAGKSVLARQWLDLDEREHLEIPLAPRLVEPMALIRAVVDALEGVGPPAEDLRSISLEEPGFSTQHLPALAGLAASRAADYLMVFDDVQLIRNPLCHEILLTVCDAIPPGSQALLLSRDEVPAWLARARGSGRLQEVTGRDLRFDADEAADLFRAMDVPHGGLDVGRVVEQTEGWAVGLYLTGLAIRRNGVRPYVGSGGSHDSEHFIADYINTQVLLPLDPDLQSFAVHTSVLDELTPDLCDAVLERDDSAAMLTRLRAQLQLVIPLDPSGHRVRYHHLLADALRSELSLRAPSEISGLNLRASAWYAVHGDLDSAIRHAKAAKDLQEVGRLVWSGMAGCLGAGERERLALWLFDLPEAQLAQSPSLSLAAAWVTLQSGQTDRMDLWIQRAQTHAGPGWRERAAQDDYAANLAVLVAIAGREGFADSGTLCAAAAQGLAPESGFRAAAMFVHGVALTLARDMEAGRRGLAEAERLARVLSVPIIQADAMSWLGVLALTAGDVPEAKRSISNARRVIHDHRLERLATAAHCLTAQAWVEAMNNEATAEATLSTARHLTTQLRDVVPWFAVCGRLLQARTAVALGQAALARQLIIEAKARMTPDLQESLAHDLLEDAEHALTLVKVDGVNLPTLTPAELRILHFLPSHLQLPQIGEQLYLSKNTVKTHVRAIHTKLGVTSRHQAVARARELGLLEPPSTD